MNIILNIALPLSIINFVILCWVLYEMRNNLDQIGSIYKMIKQIKLEVLDLYKGGNDNGKNCNLL